MFFMLLRISFLYCELVAAICKCFSILLIAADRTAVDLERQLDHDGDPLAITAADAVAANGVPPWNWREGPENGELS